MPVHSLVHSVLSLLKQRGATLKLNNSIVHDIGGRGETIKEYNIHNFAIMRIKTEGKKGAYSKWSIYAAIKKHEYAKDWSFTVDISCSDLDSGVSFIVRSTNWSNWIKITNETTRFTVNFDIQFTFIEIQPIANIKLHEDETLTDFQLSAEDGSVAVHRAYLAAHSDVFKTMLHGQWKETAEGRVEVKGVTRQTLQHFKDYIYLGMLPDDGLCPLLLLATRYLVDHLKLECMMKIIQTITAENLDAHLDFAVENEMLELKDNIIEKIPGSIFAEACAIKMKALMSKTDDEE